MTVKWETILLRTMLLAVLLIGAVATSLMSPRAAHAQSDAERKELSKGFYVEGRHAQETGKHGLAAEKFKKAYELLPVPKLLQFISSSYDRAGKIGESLQYLELYSQSSPEAAVEVKGQLEILRPIFMGQFIRSAASIVEDAAALAQPGNADKKRSRVVKVEMDGPVFHDVPYAIWTDPPGATVYINDKVWGGQGETPYQLTLFPGRHKLWVEMDFFQSIESEIIVKPLTRDSDAQKVEFKLERERVPVSIRVRPELAEIIFVSSDGSNERLGVGRWKGELPAGPAKFIVQATGVGQREFEEVVRRSAIDETGTQSLVLNLRKEDVERELAGQVGEVELNGSLIDGRVFIDGKEVGRTPGSIKRRLSPGLHRLELRCEGSYPWHSELDVKAGTTSVIELPDALVALPEPETNWGAGLSTTLGILSLAGGGVFTFASVSPETLSIAGKDKDQLLSFVLYGVGATALTTGIVLFALDDEVEGQSANVFVLPIAGGWAAGLGWTMP